MTDLPIASFAPQGYARERAVETSAAREAGEASSFAKMAEQLEKGRSPGPDQKAGRLALSTREIVGSGRWDPRDPGAAEPEGAKQSAGQDAAPAIETQSDPVALFMGAAATPIPAAVPPTKGQASEQKSADIMDLPISSMAERPDKAKSLGPEQKVERPILSAQEIVIARSGERRDPRDANVMAPEDAKQVTAAPVIEAKSDPVALLMGLATASIPAVAPSRVSPPAASSSDISSSPALPLDASLPQDAQTMAASKPVEQVAREGHRQARDAFGGDALANAGADGRGAGLKIGEIVELESTSHFAPSGSALQQVAAAVRDSLGPAMGAPVKTAPDAAVAREMTPTLHVLNLKLQPESLGDLAIHMRLSGETLSMHIKVSDAATLASFQSGSNKLEDLLKSSGYQVDKLTIVAAPSAAADPASPGDAGPRRDGNPSTMTPSGDQRHDRDGQAPDGRRGEGRQNEFKGNGHQSHEASVPRTARAGVYL